MASRIDFNDDVTNDASRRGAELLARVAVLIQTAHKQALSKSFPPASRAGEYPRGRTWGGRDGTVFRPERLSDLAREQTVKIGYLQNSWYMASLEVYHKRLGLQETVNRLKSSLQALGMSAG